MDSITLLQTLHQMPAALIGTQKNLEKIDVEKLAQLNFCKLYRLNVLEFADSTDFMFPSTDSIQWSISVSPMFERIFLTAFAYVS